MFEKKFLIFYHLVEKEWSVKVELWVEKRQPDRIRFVPKSEVHNSTSCSEFADSLRMFEDSFDEA